MACPPGSFQGRIPGVESSVFCLKYSYTISFIILLILVIFSNIFLLYYIKYKWPVLPEFFV